MFARLPLIAAAAATLAMATGAVSADERTRLMIVKPAQSQAMIAQPQRMIIVTPRRMDIDCPEGWVWATPPLNWQLGCLPNTILGN